MNPCLPLSCWHSTAKLPKTSDVALDTSHSRGIPYGLCTDVFETTLGTLVRVNQHNDGGIHSDAFQSVFRNREIIAPQGFPDVLQRCPATTLSVSYYRQR